MTQTTAPKANSPLSSSSDLLGSTEPSWATPPLRDLADPRSTYGYAVIQFARVVCRTPLDPWEEWLVLRCGELTGDNLPRFRTVLTIVARQNGKTFLLRILAAFWLFVEKHAVTVGVANKLSLALESWATTVKLAQSRPALEKRIDRVLTGAGREALVTKAGARYVIAAAGRDAARGLTVNRAIWDECRQERDWETHAALAPTMAAVVDAQMFLITNMGDDESVVLNDTIDNAYAGVDPGLGMFLWAAHPDCDPLDPGAWAAANPNLGRRLMVAEISAAAARAVQSGGEALARFKTERLCIRVRMMNPAVDPNKWRDSTVLGDMADLRDRVALGLDVALDEQHATVVAAAVMPDGRCRLEVVAAFEGQAAADELGQALPRLVDRVKPRAVGWLPGGPAASLLGDLAPRQGWPPPGVEVAELRSELAAVCMAFAKAVTAGQVVHSADPLLDAHVQAAERKARGDTWVFSRRGGHVDAAYAAAAAVFLARSLRAPRRTVLPTPLS